MKPEWIARQSAHPTGLVGHVVARVMARDTARVNARVLALLALRSGERVLEIGCGHGRTLREVARRVAPGLAAGVDPSAVMRSVARRDNRAGIAARTVEIEDGHSAALPYPDGSFDKIFSVHSLYFWPSLERGLREIRRVLRAGGTLLLAFHDGADPRVSAQLPGSVYCLRSAGEVEAALRDAQLSEPATQIDPETGLCIATARG